MKKTTISLDVRHEDGDFTDVRTLKQMIEMLGERLLSSDLEGRINYVSTIEDAPPKEKTSPQKQFSIDLEFPPGTHRKP